jgi:beta-lactamase superfamily II metal-dependent hydrolase
MNMPKHETVSVKRKAASYILLLFTVLTLIFIPGCGKAGQSASEVSETALASSDSEKAVVPDSSASGQGAQVSEKMQVYFIDVGQGDSELVRIPGSSGYFNILIDCGETVYRKDLVSFIEELGITRLDAIVATHPIRII